MSRLEKVFSSCIIFRRGGGVLIGFFRLSSRSIHFARKDEENLSPVQRLARRYLATEPLYCPGEWYSQSNHCTLLYRAISFLYSFTHPDIPILFPPLLSLQSSSLERLRLPRSVFLRPTIRNTGIDRRMERVDGLPQFLGKRSFDRGENSFNRLFAFYSSYELKFYYHKFQS